MQFPNSGETLSHQYPQHRQIQFEELTLQYRLHFQDPEVKQALKILCSIKMTARERVSALILVVRSRTHMQTLSHKFAWFTFSCHVHLCAFLALELEDKLHALDYTPFMSQFFPKFARLNPQTTTKIYLDLLCALHGVCKFPADPTDLDDRKFDYQVEFKLQRVRTENVNDIWISNQTYLGNGSFGKVYGANCHLNRSQRIQICQPLPCAIKTVIKDEKTNTVKDYTPFYREVTALQWLQSLDVQVDNVRLQGVPRYYFSTLGNIYMERAVCNVRHILGNQGFLMEIDQRVRFFYEVLHVMEAIHQRGMAHMDLKPDNICVSNNGRPLVVDWGTCHFGPVFEERPHKLTCTTLWYRAPEDFDRAKNKIPNVCPAKIDVFSLGCILVELLTHQTCFQGNTITTTYTEVCERLTRVMYRLHDLAIRNPSFARFKAVTEKMLCLSPATRPTLAEVLQEPCWEGISLSHRGST